MTALKPSEGECDLHPEPPDKAYGVSTVLQGDLPYYNPLSRALHFVHNQQRRKKSMTFTNYFHIH